MRFVCAVLFYFFTGIYSSVFAQQFPVNEQCRVNVHAMEAVRTDSMQHVPASGRKKSAYQTRGVSDGIIIMVLCGIGLNGAGIVIMMHICRSLLFFQ